MSSAEPATPARVPVVLGRVSGVFGTRGWLKIYSYTRPRDNIFNYSAWQLCDRGAWHSFALAEHRRQGAALVVRLAGIDDRDAAAGLIGRDIGVDRDVLPDNAAGEYYWADLIGLQVVNQDGIALGSVTRLLETGANDVLVIDGPRQRLIPYVIERYVVAVDLAERRMIVDWHVDD